MENLEKLLSGMQLHPVVDHYTVALLTVAVLIDLAASLFPLRGWLRNSALTLMILGALAAAGSFWTGNMEADRLWDMMSPEAQQYFKGSPHFLGHGALGTDLMYVFAALALWRLLMALFSFMQGSRGLYLLAAVISLGFLFYQAHTGGQLVYRYGVGTGPMAAGAPPPLPTPEPEPATPIPTVFVPMPIPTPEAAMPTPPAMPAPPGGSPMSPSADASPAASRGPGARSSAEANL